MSAAEPNVRELSAQDRLKLDDLLGDFHRTWSAGRLDRVLVELPADLPYRLAAVTGLAAIDLEMRWQQGDPARVEAYLQSYPELGTAENVSVELLLAEFFAQERYETAPDLNAFLARFPQQADDLRRLIALARSPRMSGMRARPSGNTSIHSQQTEDGPALPEQFDRYRILKKLGQGGMGTVYLAHDTRLDRKVALKVPRIAPGSNHENLERFYREAKATATITHPNLCPLYDVGEVEGTPFLTMAYIEGWPLSKFIRPDKLLPQFGVATVVRIVAQAIEEAHKRGVIHRDLKPGNIMINKRGEPIVMDFGLARWVNADKEDVRLTRSGAILGAPVYMSPEQVYGDVDAMGPGCDVYSLGVILYELLTGRLPFEGPTTAVLAKTLIQAPRPPSAHRPDVDPRLEAICLKAMAKKISERFASMAEVAAALTEYIRAERQAQTLTSLSATKLPANGSGALAETLPGNGSSSSVVRKNKTKPLHLPAAATQVGVNEEATEILAPESVPVPSLSKVSLSKPPSSRLGLWVGLASVVSLAALLCLGLLGWLLWPPPPPTSAPPSAAVTEGTIQIALSETPADVEVRLDGEALEPERLKKPLTLKPGEYHLEVKSDKFDSYSRPFVVEAGVNPRLEVTLRPKEPVVIKVKKPVEPTPGVLFEGPGGAIKSVAWSADGGAVLSGGEDFHLRLLDAGTREVKQLFTGHTLPVTSVALSKDGTRTLSGGGDGLVIVWNVKTGAVLHRLEGHKDWVRSVAISPDGRWGLSGGDDKTVRLWDLDNGVERKQFSGHTGTVWTVAFSPDGKRAASGSEDQTIRLWNLETLTEAKRLSGHVAAVRSVAFVDAGRVLSGSDDRTLRLWDVGSGQVLKHYLGHAGKVRAVSVSADGKQAVSASFGDNDNTVRLWDIDKGTLLYALGSTSKGNNTVAFAPNERWVVSGGDDGALRLWDARVPWQGTLAPPPAPPEVGTLEVRRLTSPKHEIDRVAVSKDGRYALSAGYDGTVHYWDLLQGRDLRRIPVMPKGTVHFVAFSPDERQVLACGDDKLATLWNLDTGKLVQKFEGHTDKVWCAIFTPDGKHIITSSGNDDPTARLWEVATGMEVKTFTGHTKTINALALSPDGKRLLTASWDASLRVWDVETAKQLHSFKAPAANVSTVAFFPDGRRAAAGSGPKVVIYDVSAFKELLTLEEKDLHKGGVWIVAVSPGGHRIVSAGPDKVIGLWDADTGKLLHKYTGHTKSVPGLAFLPDGTRFLSGSRDATLCLWALPRNLYDPPPLPASEETKTETQLLQSPAQPLVFVEQVSFTADGKRALWSGDDNTVHVWNLAARKEVAHFTPANGKDKGIRSFALLPNGKQVLAACYDGTLRLWDFDTGKEVRKFTGHDKRARSVVVTPDGKRAVSVGDDKFLHLWNVDTAQQLQKWPAHEGTIFALALTPNGHEAITGGTGNMDKTIRRWNLDTGTEIARWKTGGDIHSVAVSPDGRRVLSGGKDKLVQLWDRESGSLLANFVGHTGIVTCVRFSPDGRWALSTSDDKTMRLWNIETSQEMARFNPNSASIKGVAFSPDGRQALTGNADSSVRLWTLPDYTAPLPVDSLKTYTSPDKLDRVALSPDGQFALSAGYDKQVRLWNVDSGAEVKVYDWHKDVVHYVSFSPDGKRAASGSQDKTAVVWDVDSGNLVRRIEGHKGTVWGVQFSPDGTQLLTCSEDGTAVIWDLETGAAVQTFTGHSRRINAAAWTPDGTRIVTASIDKTARLWDVATGKELKRYEGHTDGVATIAVSPNACYVATGSYDTSVRLWDINTAKCLHIFDGHTAQVWNVAFSPDSRRLLSGGKDKTMKLWDVASRQLLHSYDKHKQEVTGVVFHPDGRRALSSSMDKTMRLWGLPVY